MAFRVGTALQSGRQALLRKDCVQALPYFEEAARLDPNYVFRSAHFSQGVWSYVGRCQYAAGTLAQARQSLELALTKDKDDILARLYLGATLLRSGEDGRGQSELTSALQSLHHWIENLLASRSAESYWDANKQIRSEIKKTLALMARSGGAHSELLSNAEWPAPRSKRKSSGCAVRKANAGARATRPMAIFFCSRELGLEKSFAAGYLTGNEYFNRGGASILGLQPWRQLI